MLPPNLPIAVLIPAYRPNHALIDVVGGLTGRGLLKICVIDDGSGPAFTAVFNELAQLKDVEVLRHAVNLGKGAALKTGINHLLADHPELPGVITADADGQHHPDDIIAVCERFLHSQDSLVLGARAFAGDVPLRSRFGNALTRRVMRLVVGHQLADTQTGLRAIPRALGERLLKITTTGYDFEIEMLVAAKHLGVGIVEQPIRTIYEPGNPTSHFQPLRDSMRIYLVLLRFSMISLATALVDNAIFWIMFHFTANIAGSQLVARAAAVTFNYRAVRKAVFFSDQSHAVLLPRYLALVGVNMLLSYAGIRALTMMTSVGVFPAKILIESLLFIANFAIQRDFIFTRRAASAPALPYIPPPPDRTWRNPGTGHLIAFCIITALVAATYANHWNNGFHYDDFHTIQENPYIRSLKNIPRFFTDAETFSTLPANRTWRPIVSTSLAIDYYFARGLNPRMFLISTFFWYLLQLWLVYALFLRILNLTRPGNKHVALFATALYAVHPVMAETVNYIIQRGDVYSTLAVLAGLVIYACEPHWRKYGIYLIPIAVGLLSKPPAMVFPAILWIYLWLFEDLKPRKAFARILPSLLLVALSAALSKAMTPASFYSGADSPSGYRMTQPLVALRYFRSLFLPTHLNADSDFGMVGGFFKDYAWLGFLFVAIVVIIAVKCSKPRHLRPIAFGLWWFLIALIPTAVFPLAEMENDHRMFFPFVGLVLSICWALALYLESRKVPRTAQAIACVVILSACSWGTWQRNKVWNNEETLWYDVTLKSPTNGRGLMNYGLTQLEKSDYRRAQTYFERAVQYTPDYYILQVNLGIVDGYLGNDAEAERYFLQALDLAPEEAVPHYFYAVWLRDRNRIDEAIAQLNTAIQSNPSYLDSEYLLMQIYSEQGNAAALAATARYTLSLFPTDETAQKYLQ